MANLNLDDLVKHIAHDTDNTTKLGIDTLIKDDISGSRVINKVNAANAAASYDDARELFSGRKSGVSQTISSDLEQLKELKASLEEAGGSASIKRFTDSQQKQLAKKAEGAFYDVAKGVKHHEEVLELALKQEVKIKEQVAKRYIQEQKAMVTHVEGMGLGNAAKADEIRKRTENLLNNRTAVLEKVEEHFSDLKSHHAETVGNLKKMVGEIEKETGLSSAKYFEKAGATAIGAEAAASGGNVISRGFKAFGKAPGFNKVAAGVGSIVVLDGLKNAAQIAGAWPKATDEQGKEVPTDGGKLIKTAAELGGGAFIVMQALKGHMPAKSL